jgi:hypothetical protein
LRQQLHNYRRELEEKARREFAEFARNPHPLPPPKEFRGDGPRGKRPPAPEAKPDRPSRPKEGDSL